VVLDAERDELLDSAGAEAWAGTGVVNVMIPVMLDHVDARAIVPIAVAGRSCRLPLPTKTHHLRRLVYTEKEGWYP